MSAVTNHSTPATGRDPTMGHIARECGATGAPLAAGHHTKRGSAMMYLNPENMPRDYQARIVRWLAANGCRDVIALEPITVRGKVAEYQAICRKNKTGREWEGKPGGIQLTPDLMSLTTTTRRLRIRIPLQDVA